MFGVAASPPNTEPSALLWSTGNYYMMYLQSRIDDVRRCRHIQKLQYSSKLGSWIHFQILIEHYQYWSTCCNGLHIITYHLTPLVCLFFH